MSAPRPFDRVIMVDWSGGNDRGPSPKADAIWAGVAAARGSATAGSAAAERYFRNRQAAETWLTETLEAETAAGRRVLVGFDFPFGFPRGFAEAVTGQADPLALWAWLEGRVEDTPHANNRFDLAGEINGRFPGTGPFWGNGLKRDIPGLPRKGRARTGHGMAERREAETRAAGAFPIWQLAGAGAVGSQAIMGVPVLARLRRRFRAAAWPFEPLEDAPVALIEIWPSLIAPQLRALARPGEIRDQAQVRLLAQAVAGLAPEALAAMLRVDEPAAREEGWILGLGHEAALAAAAGQPEQPDQPDQPATRVAGTASGALPAGIDWTPVDDALARLRAGLGPVTGVETVALSEAAGRILAEPARARRDNPACANSAVDGYAFAHRALGGAAEAVLPLAEGRAAAGHPAPGPVPEGHALRILTGATLPQGADTVVLEEDTVLAEGAVRFPAPRKPGANTRAQGEDARAGSVLLKAGRQLTPGDLARLAVAGVDACAVRARLRLGILSTGDELIQPGEAAAGGVYDANRPMLLALARAMGFAPVDLGAAPDRPDAVRAALDRGAAEAHAIVTSGGASSGDEDHVSRLLRAEGEVDTWRIAVKPGRPLALGRWRDTPLFGLPGNPVAAFVTFLIFARPALRCMAGAPWEVPEGYRVPAGFEKRKKPGRREYLRARIGADGRAEAFRSEGSGLVGGLSWATGLVELPDGAAEISPGDPVRFIPFVSFGI